MTFGFVFTFTWAVLIFGPPAGTLLMHWLLNKRSKVGIWWLGKCCMAYLAVFLLAAFTHVTTVFPAVNFNLRIAAFLAYCCMVPVIWTCKPSYIFRPVGILMYASFLPGYLLATVGILGLGFILDDEVRPPDLTERLGPGLYCTDTTWGMAADPSGQDIDIYREPAWLPFIKYRIAAADVDITDPHILDTNCSSLGATVTGNKPIRA